MDDLFVLCNLPPLFILIKHDRNGAAAFTGLDKDITPLYPIESRGEVDGVSFTRIQVPITPAFAITDFKSQGKSVAEACVDIKTSHTSSHRRQPGVNHKNYTSLNVQLGRIKSFAGLWLREPIELADVQNRPDPALLIEDERLRNLEAQTMEIWSSNSWTR
jgi:hypothetical protein